MSTYEFCFTCGNNKVLPNGEVCPDCNTGTNFEGFGDTRVCNFIPEDYARLKFDHSLVPSRIDSHALSVMTEISTKVPRCTWHSNVFLHSKPKSSKTVLAYSTITQLFLAGVSVFPLMDIKEIANIARDINNGFMYKHSQSSEYDITDLYESKYLFVKVNEADMDTINAMYSILDRRSRRGNVTIFLSIVTWASMLLADKTYRIGSLEGDGTLGTVRVVGG